MFQNSEVANLWDEVGGDIEAFTSILKEAGYNNKAYEQGTGPSYAEIHQQIHGESYETLIARADCRILKRNGFILRKNNLFSVSFA